MRLPFPVRWIPGLACLAAACAGCEPSPRQGLVVATSWPASDRRQIEAEFARWLSDRSGASTAGPFGLEWLVLSPGDEMERLTDRRDAPDVLLGAPALVLDRLARDKRLASPAGAGPPAWLAATGASPRVVSPPDGDSAPAGRSGPSPATFDDPRRDPVSLAWAEARLRDAGSFREGYARLVRAAGDRRRIGRTPGSAAAEARRGAAHRAPGVAPGEPPDPEAGAIPRVEGVAVLAGRGHPERAARFLDFLVATGRARAAPPRPSGSSPDELDLLADLLGATLVDAQDELWAARTALDRAGSPPNPLRWMTQPPPWPPASIEKILDRQDESAMAMVETLTGQIATDPAVRSWLVRSWLGPGRSIDRDVLRELAGAVDGRLTREPRFREWLRAEWTAWARQRYRRVTRAVGGH